MTSSTLESRKRPVLFIGPQCDREQDAQIGNFRPYLRAKLKHKKTLEIGASYQPMLPKREGFNSFSLDHGTRDELAEKYRSDPTVNVDNIEKVDFIWNDGDFSKCCGDARFDAVISSHVIEHAPDFVSFLNSCAAVLAENGEIAMIVPDKRYCFDFINPVSDPASVISDHCAGRSCHSFETFYRGSAAVRADGQIAWTQAPLSELMFIGGDPRSVLRDAPEKANSSRYVDAHANYFTPVSFLMLVDELHYLGLLDIEVHLLTRSRGAEFLVEMRKAEPDRRTFEEFAADKRKNVYASLAEQREWIDFVLPPGNHEEAQLSLAMASRELSELKRSRLLKIGRVLWRIAGRPVPY